MRVTNSKIFLSFCIVFVVALFSLSPLDVLASSGGAKQNLVQKYIVNPLSNLFLPFFLSPSGQVASVYQVTINKSEVANPPISEKEVSAGVTLQKFGMTEEEVKSLINHSLSEFSFQNTSSGEPKIQYVNNTYVRGGGTEGLANSVGKSIADVNTRIDSISSSSNGSFTTLTVTGLATSTLAGGIDITGGCFSINGTCVGGGSSDWVTSGSNVYYSGGNVGVGTSSPYALFSVAGNSVFTGTTSISMIDPSQYANIRMVFEGDSLTDESGWSYYVSSQADYWPLKITTLNSLFGKATRYNYALGGDTAANMVSEYSSQAATKKPTKGSDEAYFFLWAGSNDIYYGSSASDIYNNLKTIWAAARADGYKVVAFTIMPRDDIDSGQESIRVALNNLIISDLSLYDYLIRVDKFLSDSSDTTYFEPDGIHLNEAGNLAVARNVNLALTRPSHMYATGGTTALSASLDLYLNPEGRNVLTDGDLGVGGTNPSAYEHGGTNKIVEISNLETSIHSQAQLVLSSGVNTVSESSIGGISWALPFTAASNKITAMIVSSTRSADVNNPASDLRFATRSTAESLVAERMRISDIGQVGIATTSPWRTLSVNGTVAVPGLVNDSTGYYACVNTTTGQLSTSTTACGASSERFKENIENIGYGLEEVLGLRPVSFDYKSDYIPNAPKQLGFIAEEVDLLVPELVARDEAGQIQGLDYPKFTAVLVRSVQELNEKIGQVGQIIGDGTNSLKNLVLDSLSSTVIYTKEINAEKINAGDLNISGKVCVDDTCVTKDQFKEMILRSGVGALQVVGGGESIVENNQGNNASSTDNTSTTTPQVTTYSTSSPQASIPPVEQNTVSSTTPTLSDTGTSTENNIAP